MGNVSVEKVWEIRSRLEKANSPWAKKTLQSLCSKCPTSLKLELECIRRGRNLTIREVMNMEICVAMQCMKGKNFVEGVRALIVEKDNLPVWVPSELEQVTRNQIFAFF